MYVTLDLSTLYIVGGLGMLVAGLIHLVLVAVGRFGRWAALWGVGHLCVGGCAIIAMIDDRTNLYWAPFVSNPAMVLGFALITSAVVAFHRPDARIVPILASAVVLALPFLFFAQPAYHDLRGAYLDVVRAGFDTVVVVVAIRMARRQSLQTGWIVATLFGVTVPLFVGRAWLTYAHQVGMPHADMYDHIGAWFAAGQIAFVVFRGFSLLMLQAESGQKALMDQMERDWLTGALNRAGLDRVARTLAACTTAAPIVVMMLDVDRFKALNDTQGHAAGDAALRTLATIAREALGDSGHVARWGGDEFVCILPDATIGHARTIGGQLAARFTQIMRQDVPHEFAPSISIGIAQGVATRPIEDVIARADMAMYAAKADRRTTSDMRRETDGTMIACASG